MERLSRHSQRKRGATDKPLLSPQRLGSTLPSGELQIRPDVAVLTGWAACPPIARCSLCWQVALDSAAQFIRAPSIRIGPVTVSDPVHLIVRDEHRAERTVLGSESSHRALSAHHRANPPFGRSARVEGAIYEDVSSRCAHCASGV